MFASRSPALLDEDDRSASPDADGSARGGALGMALSLFIWSGQSPPTSDHPASISLGTPMGTGVASPAEYFSSLALVALFIFPIVSRASFLDTWIVSVRELLMVVVLGVLQLPLSECPKLSSGCISGTVGLLLCP